MENTSQSSCIISTSMSSGESSWAMHVAEFLASPHNSQEMDHQGVASEDSSFSSGFSSSFASLRDTASFITSDLMFDDDDEDESLQDTACSSATGPKAPSIKNIDMKSMVTMDAKGLNTLQLAKSFVDVVSRHHVTDVAQDQAMSGDNNNEKALYECNDLRKKGLCLVPLSMLINYLG